ncbi:MarR family winged helix-turn-helix transcriptional regulator [Robiginitalea sp. SC105]|uniref:MarR family winged helix-turn-helix transcriptional regulator n=1 Tax=Robiginitalea sp. SC105 TaxID=2762332 RepID=UPI001639E378|nr:MarR family transcriptional regulator [Robiginitalea sp. SC105]MBC2839122.1 MarR family transcriptional regulator [Robiginitalea sp. SC105]
MNVEAIIKTDAVLPPQRRTIIHLLLVHNRINEAMANALKPFGVSMQQFNVLRILRGQKGEPANMSTLNERMVTKMSNTTRLVDKLIAKGLVRRNVCPDNRRKVEIFLTPDGREQLLVMDQVIDAEEKQLMEQLSGDQLQELNKLLDLIK